MTQHGENHQTKNTAIIKDSSFNNEKYRFIKIDERKEYRGVLQGI